MDAITSRSKSRLFSKLGIVGGCLAIFFALLCILVTFEVENPDSGIRTIPDALWYAVVTLTTVGYGDISPTTTGGKVIGYIFVFGSVGVLGLLIGNLLTVINDYKENKRLGKFGCQLNHHIVIVGWNKFANLVTEQLINASVKVAIVVNDKTHVDAIREYYSKHKVFVLYSDFDQYDFIRKKTCINDAINVFVNLDDDTENLVLMINYQRKFKHDLQYSVILHNSELHDTFKSAGASNIISKDDIAAKIVASFIFEPYVAEYTEDLISSATHEEDYDIQEYRVISENIFLNHKYNDLYFELRKNYDCLLIGLVRTINGKRTIIKNPNDDKLRIEEGDYLILITNGPGEIELAKAFGIKEGILR